MRLTRLATCLLIWATTNLFPLAQTPDLRQEEAVDYYSKWLNQDVKYILSEEERQIFLQLQTNEERERFIEEFWLRRDPDPRTAANEFKEEHYRRIAYANDHFESGFAGWRTDRGRVYILYGPPDEKENHASGGGYERPLHEGGGGTATYPFEIWRYRYLEGLGSGIELEFVDKSWTGDFQLALSADEKDVFLKVAGHGLTKAEQLGLANKFQRLTMTPAVRELYPLMHHRIKDSPFLRYETFSRIKAPAEFKHPDLQQAVAANISFDEFPFRAQPHYFQLNPERVLAPLTLEFDNKQLSYREQEGGFLARIALYGAVTNLQGRIVLEFEDDLISAFPADGFKVSSTGTTLFQKLLFLEPGRRYKLDLVAKDVYGEKTGLLQKGLIAPAFDSAQLRASSLLLADYVEQLAEIPGGEAMFVLGDFKVRPSVAKTFPRGGTLGLYLQLYGSGIDQSSGAPSLRTRYRILRQGRPELEVTDEAGQSALFYSDQRVVLVRGLSLQDLEPASYEVEIEIHDRVRDETIKVADRFQIRD